MGDIKYFFCPTVIKVICKLKGKNTNINQFAKTVGITYSHAINTINTLYIYDLVDIDKVNRETQFNLTEDGLKVRDFILQINQILREKRDNLHSRLYGYESREKLLKDIEDDLKCHT